MGLKLLASFKMTKIACCLAFCMLIYHDEVTKRKVQNFCLIDMLVFQYLNFCLTMLEGMKNPANTISVVFPVADYASCRN